MQLTVLGCYGPYPPAGQCCSGYLLQNEGVSVLLDCGNGVLSRLRYYLEPWQLQAVILSHLHSDHISDLLIMRYALLLNKKVGEEPLKVYAPEKPNEEFMRLSYKNVVQAHPVYVADKISVGGMNFTFTAGQHAVPSFIITVECNGKRLVYSGDTEYFTELPGVVKNADLFICEANYLKDDIEKGSPNHMAAYQAAETARDGHVGRLVLTHHHPERNPNLALQEACSVFERTELAQTGSYYYL